MQLTSRVSPAVQFPEAAASVKLPRLTEVVELAVCFVMKTVLLVLVWSVAVQYHPFAAVGIVSAPTLPVGLPMVMANTAVPLVTIVGPVPNPDAIVGAVADMTG